MQIITYEDMCDYKTKAGKDFAYKVLRRDFLDAVINGTAYVRLVGTARAGTIGIARITCHKLLTPERFDEFRIDKIPQNDHEDSVGKYISEFTSYDEYLIRFNYYVPHFELFMDDGTQVSPAAFDTDYGKSFEWLVDYVGPTVKCFVKTSKAEKAAKAAAFVPVFKDAFGHLIEPGQFVSVIIDGKLTVGKVTELVRTGKSVRVKALMRENPTLISDSTKIIVIDDELKTRAMMKKLTGC